MATDMTASEPMRIAAAKSAVEFIWRLSAASMTADEVSCQDGRKADVIPAVYDVLRSSHKD